MAFDQSPASDSVISCLDLVRYGRGGGETKDSLGSDPNIWCPAEIPKYYLGGYR